MGGHGKGLSVAMVAFLFAGCPSATPKPGVLDAVLPPGQAPAVAEEATLYPIIYNKPEGPPTLNTGEVDAHGQPITVACTVCHTTKEPNFDLASSEDLEIFHQGMTFHHGEMTCLTCHNPDDYNTLRLADGRPLAYPEVMQLCAQCHGQEYRDYERGAHGGMTGYWDRSRGPQYRNNCIDCHDPHYPAFQGMIPAPGPRDRFLSQAHHAIHGEEAPHD